MVDDRFEDQHRSGTSQNRQRLASKQMVQTTADSARQETFDRRLTTTSSPMDSPHSSAYHIVVRCFAEQPTEGNNRRQAREVQKDDRRHRLKRNGIGQVRDVERRFAFDVVDQAAAEPTRTTIHTSARLALLPAGSHERCIDFMLSVFHFRHLRHPVHLRSFQPIFLHHPRTCNTIEQQISRVPCSAHSSAVRYACSDPIRPAAEP